MRGEESHDVLRRLDARFVSSATTRELRTLVDLGPYPALLPLPSATSHVPGELWDLDAVALEELDRFEDCPDLYTRDRVIVLDDTRAPREAFVYVLTQPPPASARVIARFSRSRTSTPRLTI